MMSSSLADHLQIWGFEGDTIVFLDASLGFGLELEPLDVSCWDGDRINDLADRTSQFLNGLPSGVSVQFVQDILPGNSERLKEHQKIATIRNEDINQALVSERIGRLARLDHDGKLPKHSLKLFVRRPMGGQLISKIGIFSKTSQVQNLSEERLERELNATNRLKEDLAQSFASMGVNSRTLSTEDVIDLMYLQWNPARRVERQGYDPEDVRSSLLFTDLALNERGFSLADIHYRVISLKILPDQTFASMATALRSLPFDSRLFLTIHAPDQQSEIATLQTQRRLAFSMARGKTEGVSDIESEAKLEDLETLLSEMIAQGEKVFHVSFNVLLKSTDLNDLDDQVSQTLLRIRELSGAEGMEETVASFDVFSQIAIPHARAKERNKKIKTSNLADFLPIYGPWVGHQKPSILLRSRMGSLVGFDPFSPSLTNYNQIVSGGSGSGKSFLTNILLLHMLKENPKVFIVDIGGSYKKLCDNINGQYIPLGVDSGLSISPFDLLPGETVPSSQKIKFLVSLVELMTKEEGQERLPRLERAEIEEAIQKTYESSEGPSFSTLRKVLLGHESVEIRRFGRILTPWCGDTAYGRFVDRKTNVTLEKQTVSFDLKGLEVYPDLQSVCLFIITDFVWREVQKDRSSKKFLVFDECWKLLENSSGATFIAEVFRTFRKYHASAIAISQNIDDFARSKVASAILPNSSVKWILMQKGADQKRLKEVLQLNSNEMDLISSLHQERGIYSEALLIAQDDKSVVAIESTPLEYWIATTDPRDLAQLDAEISNNSGLSQLEVLNNLAGRFPRGVVASKGGEN